MTVEDVTFQRKAREAKAKEIADTLPCADYYASGNALVRCDDHTTVMTLDSHWDACLVMMATAQRRYA